jgi:hypothetical protein
MLGAARPIRAAGVAVAAVLLAVLASAAFANAAEYEPNDTRETAYGPLSGGVDYKATFETQNDVDWYVFYIRTYSQMDFSATTISSSCSRPLLELRDKDGKPIQSFSGGYVSETNHLRLTLNAGRYYFEISTYSCPGEKYSFRIDPAASITPNRECGEAIVAKESVIPEATKLQGELAKNSEALAKANGALRANKAALARLIRHHASRYNKQRARRRLTAARTARGKVLEQRVALQTLGAQYAQTLTVAEGQIAVSC